MIVKGEIMSTEIGQVESEILLCWLNCNEWELQEGDRRDYQHTGTISRDPRAIAWSHIAEHGIFNAGIPPATIKTLLIPLVLGFNRVMDRQYSQRGRKSGLGANVDSRYPIRTQDCKKILHVRFLMEFEEIYAFDIKQFSKKDWTTIIRHWWIAIDSTGQVVGTKRLV